MELAIWALALLCCLTAALVSQHTSCMQQTEAHFCAQSTKRAIRPRGHPFGYPCPGLPVWWPKDASLHNGLLGYTSTHSDGMMDAHTSWAGSSKGQRERSYLRIQGCMKPHQHVCTATMGGRERGGGRSDVCVRGVYGRPVGAIYTPSVTL